MAKHGKDYFGWNRVLSIILAIIPVTAFVLGFVTRIAEGKIVAAIVRILLGWNIIWIVDLVLMIVNGSIWRLIDC